MRRDLSRLTDRAFDLLVVGAGIHGACVAWDACLRGLSVAVVDRHDFGAATTANSLRIVHGGLRYLARADLPRMLESIRERSALLRIAPSLVEPLPVLVPTYRGPTHGRLTHRLALALNDLVSAGCNRGLIAGRKVLRGRSVSRAECLHLVPWFPADGLTGGALWYDATLRHPERLTLAFLRSAAGQGAVPANYVRVDRLRLRDGIVEGAQATDAIGGSTFEIRARAVVVAAGPWTSGLISRSLGSGDRGPAPGRAVAVNVMITRRLAEVAVGVQARGGPDEDPVCGGRRFLFGTPQDGTMLVGTWYAVADGSDPRGACERGARSLVRELTDACPRLELSTRDVAGYQWGWLPLKAGLEPGRATALAERPRIVDHARADGVRHLFSVEGVKFTTARRVAEKIVDQVFTTTGRKSPPCRTARVRVDDAMDDVSFQSTRTMGRAEILRAVREEMALKLSDLLFRRSHLRFSELDRETVLEVARVAGAELGWDARRQEAEIEAVMRQAGIRGLATELAG